MASEGGVRQVEAVQDEAGCVNMYGSRHGTHVLGSLVLVVLGWWKRMRWEEVGSQDGMARGAGGIADATTARSVSYNGSGSGDS